MLISALIFWEGSTNTFNLLCGMVILTLFDIVVILGDHATDEPYDLTLMTHTEPDFYFDRPTYKHFI